jgi:tetratricopeptide (TPR) repeat protein
LRAEGLAGLEAASGDPAIGVQHGEKRLDATLRPTLERLSAVERQALLLSALLPADQVPLSWVRAVLAETHPEYGRDAAPGYPDPWRTLERRLVSQRLWQPTDIVDDERHPRVVRLHRLVGELIQRLSSATETSLEDHLIAHVKERAALLRDGWVQPAQRWELEPLVACARQWLESADNDGAWLANQVSGPLNALARYAEAEPLYRRALAIFEASYGPDHPSVASCLNNLAGLLWVTNRLAEAEPLLRRALAIDETSHGSDHPDVATSLNNLAMLLRATNRPAEAEPFLRRAVEILERFTRETGHEHPNLRPVRANLARVVTAEGL